MKKTILIYGLSMAALVLLLKFVDYRLFVRAISMEVYVGIIAAIFTGLGIWFGLKLTRPKVVVQEVEIEKPPLFQRDEEKVAELGLTEREMEVLAGMARGLSNQEIADQLFLSLNTVKTHSSKLYGKLDVKRRTQAVQRAKELGLLS
jgi:NarL family two-component system response regulator LiaR